MAVAGRAVSRLTRAAAALVLLTALLVGVPWALTTFVGWPLPRVLPAWSEVTDALNGASISDAVLIKSLACATWVLWALLAACFVVEGRAWLRGREAREVPLASFIQPIVRELVVSATLLVGSLRPAGSMATPTRSVPVATITLNEPAPIAARAVDAPPDAEAALQLPTCVVVPRDSLWKLAENHLGDGLRYRDIWELNQGRTFPDGRRFVDPNLIQPGWVLMMPADAIGVEATAVAPMPASPAPAPTSPTSSPTVPVTAPAAAPNAPTPTGEPTSVNGHEPAPARADHADDPDYETVPLLAGSALLAAGVIACVSRLRRRQQRNRTPGRMIQVPGADTARAEVHLRRAAVEAPYERVDLAMRVLADCLGRRKPGPCPAIAAVSVGPETIEILLTEDVNAPPGPFDVAAGGRAWTLPVAVPDDDLQPIANTQAGPAPTLVTVGTIDERSVLVDLEAGARTLVGGDPSDAEALLWTVAFDLATSNRADDVNLILVGTPPVGLDVLDRVRVVVDLDGVIDGIEAEAALLTASLSSSRHATTLDARTANPGDVLTPTVVLVASAQNGSALDRLLTAAREHQGLAVVVAGDVDGEFDRELCVEDDTLIVKPIGLRLTPAFLPPDVLTAAGDLLRVATDLGPGEQLDLDLRPALSAPGAGLTIGPNRLPLEFGADARPIVPAGHVLVRVLGPVEIVGGQQPIDRRRSVELVAYLALHPDGVDDGRLRTALWPDSAPTQAAFNETVSRARRMLGLDADGNHHVLPVDNRRYRVGPYVITDAALLEATVGGDGSVDVLRLVRGLPFEGTERGYEWAYEEGQAHRLAALIEEAGGSVGFTAIPTPGAGVGKVPSVPCATDLTRIGSRGECGPMCWRPHPTSQQCPARNAQPGGAIHQLLDMEQHDLRSTTALGWVWQPTLLTNSDSRRNGELSFSPVLWALAVRGEPCRGLTTLIIDTAAHTFAWSPAAAWESVLRAQWKRRNELRMRSF